MRTIEKIIVDLLSSNHISADEAELMITKLSQTPSSLGFKPKRTADSYWYQTNTMNDENS